MILGNANVTLKHVSMPQSTDISGPEWKAPYYPRSGKARALPSQLYFGHRAELKRKVEADAAYWNSRPID